MVSADCLKSTQETKTAVRFHRASVMLVALIHQDIKADPKICPMFRAFFGIQCADSLMLLEY
jgi:hypothetical protein